MSEVEEIAKAIQGTADFGKQALETSEKLTGFFAKVFKGPITEVCDMITDKLRFARWKRLCMIADKVNRILEDRGVKDTRAVPPKLALPIFEDSSLEEDETLASLWAKLLANAMDPNFKDEIRYAYTEIIKSLAPLDAKVLFALYNVVREQGTLELTEVHRFGMDKDSICLHLAISQAAYLIAINNLMRLQCVAPFVKKMTIVPGRSIQMTGLNEPLTIDKGTEVVVLTPLGVKFVEACLADRLGAAAANPSQHPEDDASFGPAYPFDGNYTFLQPPGSSK